MNLFLNIVSPQVIAWKTLNWGLSTVNMPSTTCACTSVMAFLSVFLGVNEVSEGRIYLSFLSPYTHWQILQDFLDMYHTMAFEWLF